MLRGIILRIRRPMVIWISDGWAVASFFLEGYYVFDKYNNKKLAISKRERALSIFGGICVGVFGIALCAAAINHMNASYSDAPASWSSAP